MTPRWLRWGLAAALCAFAAVSYAAAGGGVDDETWNEAVSQFEEDFKKKSIGFKKRGIDALPITDERTIHFIIREKRLLDSEDWWVRATAADRLSRMQIPDLRRVLHSYAADPVPTVREGVVTALGMSKSHIDEPVVLKALDDEDWRVRRAAVITAGQQRLAAALPKLAGMIHQRDRSGEVVQAGDPHVRVRNLVPFSLSDIIGRDFGADPLLWRAYWKATAGRELPVQRRYDSGTFGGLELRVNDMLARRGQGPLCIVLPDARRSTLYYMPYLRHVRFLKWLLIDLPPVDAFVKASEAPKQPEIDPPVPRLVWAIEDLRRKRNVGRLVLMAHGFSAPVAVEYAVKYPDRVLGLILINPYASEGVYKRKLEAMARTPSADAMFFAELALRRKHPASALAMERYCYVRDSADLHDASDLEIVFLRRIWQDPNVLGIVPPQLELPEKGTSAVPALVFFPPESNPLSGVAGAPALRAYFKNSTIVQFESSAGLPFMEEPERFERVLRTFVDDEIVPRMLEWAQREAEERRLPK